MLRLTQTSELMALEVQTSQFGWKMFIVEELKNHWLIAITTGGGAIATATTVMMWVCLVWPVSFYVLTVL